MMTNSIVFASFAATLEGSESDVRFVYCACSICYILQDWSAINIETATNYIVNSIVRYDALKLFCRSLVNIFRIDICRVMMEPLGKTEIKKDMPA